MASFHRSTKPESSHALTRYTFLRENRDITEERNQLCVAMIEKAQTLFCPETVQKSLQPIRDQVRETLSTTPFLPVIVVTCANLLETVDQMAVTWSDSVVCELNQSSLVSRLRKLLNSPHARTLSDFQSQKLIFVVCTNFDDVDIQQLSILIEALKSTSLQIALILPSILSSLSDHNRLYHLPFALHAHLHISHYSLLPDEQPNIPKLLEQLFLEPILGFYISKRVLHYLRNLWDQTNDAHYLFQQIKYMIREFYLKGPFSWVANDMKDLDRMATRLQISPYDAYIHNLSSLANKPNQPEDIKRYLVQFFDHMHRIFPDRLKLFRKLNGPISLADALSPSEQQFFLDRIRTISNYRDVTLHYVQQLILEWKADTQDLELIRKLDSLLSSSKNEFRQIPSYGSTVMVSHSKQNTKNKDGSWQLEQGDPLIYVIDSLVQLVKDYFL